MDLTLTRCCVCMLYDSLRRVSVVEEEEVSAARRSR